MRASNARLTGAKTYSVDGQYRRGKYLLIFLVCMIAPIITYGCSHVGEGHHANSLSREANDFFNQGQYEASLEKYEQLIEKHPAAADRVLFEMGIIHAYPENRQKDYQKALNCFRELITAYPNSEYRQDSQMMILQIQNVIIKDKIIDSQHTQIKASRQEIKIQENEIFALQERIAALEQQVFTLKMESADKILIEKKARRLSLLAGGEVIKTYKIALGGNPVGPKERQGDNKTPEGTYIIDSRNSNSGYHLSLHISYPNEKDKRRARKLGVSPGGDIMIHGIKNGFGWIRASHADVDWTEGCIAVTNQEMEELFRFVPNGTIVEIRP